MACAARKQSLRVLLIALGLLLAQGMALFHLLIVPHATCEHGDLVEVAASPSDGSPLPSTERHEPSDQPQVASHGGSSGHDHCDALAVRHRVPGVGSSIGAASLAWIAPIEAHGERGEVRSVPLLLLAPKSSPPV